MIHISARSVCDECGSPAVLVCGDTFLCERCDVEINGEVENSELCSPDWSVDPQINRALCVEAGLRADRAQDGSIRSDRTSERFSGTAMEGPVCSLDHSRLVTGGESAATFSVDPGMCGFDFDADAEIARLEAEWARDILTSSRNKTELTPFPKGAF